MNCNNCKVAVPSTFIKAIVDNLCPACGKEIMTAKIYKEFGSIKDMLANSEVDEPTLIKMSALIVDKYTLVPRTQSHSVDTATKFKNPTIKRADEDPDVVEEIEEIDISALPPEEAVVEMAKRAQRAAEEEEISKNWGLEHGTYSAAAVSKKTSGSAAPPKELESLFDSESANSETLLPTKQVDAFTQARMAKLAALRAGSEYKKVSRADD